MEHDLPVSVVICPSKKLVYMTIQTHHILFAYSVRLPKIYVSSVSDLFGPLADCLPVLGGGQKYSH